MSEDMLRERNNSWFHSCVEHKKLTNKKKISKNNFKEEKSWHDNKYKDTQTRVVEIRGEATGRGKMDKMGQLDGGRGKLHFWCWEGVWYTETEMYCCAHETY